MVYRYYNLDSIYPLARPLIQAGQGVFVALTYFVAYEEPGGSKPWGPVILSEAKDLPLYHTEWASWESVELHDLHILEIVLDDLLCVFALFRHFVGAPLG